MKLKIQQFSVVQNEHTSSNVVSDTPKLLMLNFSKFSFNASKRFSNLLPWQSSVGRTYVISVPTLSTNSALETNDLMKAVNDNSCDGFSFSVILSPISEDESPRLTPICRMYHHLQYCTNT